MSAASKLRKVLFNLTFFPLFITVTVIIFAVFLLPLLFLRAVAGKRFTLRCLRWLIFVYGFIVVRVLMFPFVRVDHRRLGNPEKKRACVYVCNHRSASDAFLMALLGRELVQVVNNWPFKIPIIGWVAKRAGYLSVRGMSFEIFSAKAMRLLSQGVSVAAFPEGSRSTGAETQQFNGAVFRVALAAKVPIVPVCIRGNERIPERNSFAFTPGTIHVHELPALEWETFKEMTPFKLKNLVRALIQEEFEKIQVQS